MSDKPMNFEETLAAIRGISQNLEVLLKADMEPEKEEPEAQPEGQPEGEAQPEAQPEGQPEGQPEAQPEGQPEDPEETYEQMFQDLPEEELQNIIKAAQEVLSKKQAPAAEAPAAAPEAPNPMVEQMEKMQKSMEALRSQNEKLEKSISDLKKAAARPANKPAPTNAREIQTLSKSDEQPEMLQKSDVCAHLNDEIRKGNRKVTPMLVSYANDADSPEAMRRVYAEADRLGVKLPHKR